MVALPSAVSDYQGVTSRRKRATFDEAALARDAAEAMLSACALGDAFFLL